MAGSPSGTLLSSSEIGSPQPAPTLSQSEISRAASIAQAAGLTVTSTGNTTLSAVYPADDITVAKLMAVQNFIDRNARFPGGAGQYVVADINGNAHVFTTAIVTGGGSPAQFTQLAYALQDYAAALSAVIITGTGSLPSSSATIP